MAEGRMSYEFTGEDNAVFSRLATKMRGVGFWFEVYGVFLVLVFVYKLIPKGGHVDIAPLDLVTGLIVLFLGHWTRRGGWGFRRIAETQGNDVGLLMGALRELARFYGLIDRIIFVVVLVVIVGTSIAGLWLLKGGL